MESLAGDFSYFINLLDSNDLSFFNIRSQTNGFYIGSKAENDNEFSNWLSIELSKLNILDYTNSGHELDAFENSFAKWLLSHSSSNINGLELFEPDFSQGTTQAFDSFYYRHRNKRFRCFVGEYFYHIKTWIATGTNWSWTDGKDLTPGDALVISVPFCDTVSLHEDLNDILLHCSVNDIPVLIDMCYYPISHRVSIDLSYQCIDTVAFSLSKAWPVGNLRIGVRYTKKTVFDGQKLHSQIRYNNNLSALIGNMIIRHFPPDWVYNTRKDKYKKICNVLGLSPTLSPNFGVGDGTWARHSRKILLESYKLDFDPALFVNRICLNKIYSHWSQFERFIDNETNFKI